MPKNLVNLDALLVREDFEEVKSDPEPPPAKLPDFFRLNEIVSGITSTTLRKPDFQRETAYWNPKTVAEFVQSFVEGDVIPSIILWRSPTTGNIFVIDGAHRISALIAWAKDDYGDRTTSRSFFENKVPLEQEEASNKTRNLIKKYVGSYESLQDAAKHPENTKDQTKVTRARNADLFQIPVLWVVGNAKKAEESFYKINSKAVAIDPTELRMIRSRKYPSALVARAIIKGGVGHEYWAAFNDETRTEIKGLARAVHEILFVPPLPKTPLTTLDLPIAGRSYSGGDSLGLIFDFVNLVNGQVHPKQKGKEQAKLKEIEDVDGQQTVAYLKNVQRVAQRLSGKHSSSLGLHPAVYFYGITGRYQPTAFLATMGLIQNLEHEKKFNWFTQHRAAFEEFLLGYRYFTNQIVSQFGGRLKSYDALLSYYKVVLKAIAERKSPTTIADSLQKGNEFRYLKERDKDTTTRADFSASVKTVTYVREAIEKAIRCKICHARISSRSISYDHKQRREDKGLGDADNAQMTHPYCNGGYKESGAEPIPMPIIFSRVEPSTV